MEEEKEKKKGFNFIKLLIILIIIYIIGFTIYKIFMLPVNNIYIENNNYLTDQEIIDTAKLSDYPSFLLTTRFKIKKNLLSNKQIKSVKIKKQLGRVVTITIEENTPLFIYQNRVVLDNGEFIDKDYVLPTVTNDIDKDIFDKFVSKYSSLNDEIRILVSEIKYDPDNLDDERFLFTMNDGNSVYITLYKISNLNEYIKIQNTLEGKTGILHLDSGSYFEIVE